MVVDKNSLCPHLLMENRLKRSVGLIYTATGGTVAVLMGGSLHWLPVGVPQSVP